jgi:uncharacterized membrane protein
MKNLNLVMANAITGVLAAGLLSVAGEALAAEQAKPEKCYGIVKAGKNDCQTAGSSCAGTAKQDAQKDAWISLPKGTCEKIVGASLTPK